MIFKNITNKKMLFPRLNYIYSKLKKIYKYFFIKKSIKNTRPKAIWYHWFNLYAFTILKNNYPKLDFWESDKFKKILNFIDSKKNKNWLVNNDFWLDYNLSWIEISYALQNFVPNSKKNQKYWLEKQFIRNYDFEKKSFSKNTNDPETLTARLYEATRLENIDLDINENINKNNSPFVSVIIPHFNDRERLKICLDSLINQTYNKNNYEVIVIDNNSTEDISDFKNIYKNVIFLEENEIQGSYASRNKGLKYSKWELYAFTDSDCEPNIDWIEQWVDWIIHNNCDLLSGKVEFIFDDKNNPYEILDSITNMQQFSKSLRWEAATANLFVHKYVFDKIWLFSNELKSWWDAIFTFKASSSGFDLLYSDKAIVKHPTRSKKELLIKCIRVWHGQVSIWETKNKNRKFYFKEILFTMFPTIQKFKKYNFWFIMNIKLIIASWVCNLYRNYWRIKFIFKK